MPTRTALFLVLLLAVGVGVWKGTSARQRTMGHTEPAPAAPDAGTADEGVQPDVPSPAPGHEATQQALAAARARIVSLEARVRELESRLSGNETAPNVRFHRPLGLGWSPSQATGEPDTMQAGDFQTAWASLEPDGGTEWLVVDFPRIVQVRQIRVRETLGPGTIFMVSAILPDKTEKVLWHGTEPTAVAPVEMEFTPSVEVEARRIRIQLDTTRVPGWNEIDAVELVGADGSRQWASAAWASSSYADRMSRPRGTGPQSIAPDSLDRDTLVKGYDFGAPDPVAPPAAPVPDPR